MFRVTETILQYTLRANDAASSFNLLREIRHNAARKRAFGKGNSAVFVWVPKNAGTSLFTNLYEHAGFKRFKTMKSVARFNNSGPTCFGHMKISSLIELGVVDDKFLSESFKFGICRNPYSRTVSLYKYYQHIKRFPVEFSFKSFVKALAEDGVTPIGLYNSSSMSLANPQTQWLLDIPLDYIGRFEEIENVMSQIYDELKVKNSNNALPHYRNSAVEDFRTFYDKRSIDIVNDVFELDFEHFGYQQVINGF
jgi:hypothetical protein